MTQAQKVLFRPGEVMAIVGEHYILAGDFMGPVDYMLEEFKKKGDVSKAALEMERKKYAKQLLKRNVETKLLYQAFVSKVPKESLPQIEDQLFTQFNDVQLPSMLKKSKVSNQAELDAKLRQQGSSLYKEKRRFAEEVLAREMMRGEVDPNQPVTHEEMLDYYYANKDYDKAAKAKYERLTVLFNKHPNKATAKRKIAALGNRVLGGAPLSEVARKESESYTGGESDWISPGSLTSKPIDKALFSLPVKKLSRIIEDEKGYHIIRVTERVDSHRVSFTEVQKEISKKLKQRKTTKQKNRYIAKLKAETPIWTIFDEENERTRTAERDIFSAPAGSPNGRR